MPYHINEEESDLLFEVDGDSVRIRVKEGAGAGGDVPESIYIIKKGEPTVPSDKNVLSALRTLTEILNNNEELKKLFLRKDQPDQTDHLFKALGGLEIGSAIDSFLEGKGILLKDGRIQTDHLEVRKSMKVLELIINELQSMSGDYSFSDTGKINRIEELEGNTYRLWIDKRTDTDWTTLGENDVMYSIINDLRTGGSTYCTSWMRCLAKNTNDNTLTVVLYPDSEVPGGKNYAPAAGYNLTRRGNTNTSLDGTHNSRQDSWMLSSSQGAILFMQNVYKPILDEYNYALAIGKLPKLKLFENLPIGDDDLCLYGKTVIAQNYYKVDGNGNVSANEVSRGAWSVSVATSSPYRRVVNIVETPNGSKTNIMEIHTVYHLGCKWGCLTDKTIEEPKWNATGWQFLEGDNKFAISFSSVEGFQFFYGLVKATIVASVWFGNTDITAELLATPGADVQWTRNSLNLPDDNAWLPAIDGQKNRLKLVDEDMGRDWLQRRSTVFTCTVFIPIGGDIKVESETINFNI